MLTLRSQTRGPTRRILLILLLIHLITFSASFCEAAGDDDDDSQRLLLDSPRGESVLDIQGFRVDPNLIEETIDDTLRSKSERQHESVSTSTRHPFEHICPYAYFACNNGECIAPRWRCDGHYDCDDFSDELNCTTLDLPQHSSMALPSSAIYTAPPTRPNNSDDASLVASTAATTAGATAGLATQVYGLDFNSTVEPLMIFSTGTSIRGLWMQARIYFDIVIRQKTRAVAATQPSSITDALQVFFSMFGADTQAISSSGSPASPSGAVAGARTAAVDESPPKPDNTIVGLDMDPNNKEVFWVELGKEPGVYSAIIEDEKFEARHRRQFHGYKKVVEYGLISPEDIALDTVGKNAYITDAGLPAIVVCSYVHVHCRIIQSNIHKPRAIIADSSTGWVTFTDWGDRPGIYLQSMDGLHSEVLIDSDVIWPNGLAADQATNQLYWADARLQKIERVDLITRERNVIIRETNTNPFSVSLFENRIYWSDWSKNQIKTCNKLTGAGTQTLMRADDIYGIHIYHPDLHKGDISNPCWSKHCSHLCLLSPTNASYSMAHKQTPTAVCKCPDSMALSILDKATCYEVELAFLLINVRNYVAQVYPERIGLRVVEEIVYSKEHAIQDIASDWLHYRLFFFDAAHQAIYLADFSGRQPTFENFTTIASKSIRGFLFDHMSDNLYWLDPEAGALLMYSVSGRFQRLLRRGLDQPTSMVLDAHNRRFYIACMGAKPQIIRLSVTGSESSQLVIVDRTIRGESFGLPVALHLDEANQRLYWADARLGTIESVALDVKSRLSGIKPQSLQVHRRRLGTILSFAVYHESFIWTLQDDGYLYKASKQARKNERPTMFKLPPNPSERHATSDYKRLITVNPLNEASTSACHTTACSHGCILDSSHAAKCICPENFKLSIVNRTNCIEQSRNETPAIVASAPAKSVTAGPMATGSEGAALHNMIAHLDDLAPGDSSTSKHHGGASTATAAANPFALHEHHTADDSHAAAMMAHEQPAMPLHFDDHEQQQQQHHNQSAASTVKVKDESKESNRVVWLIVFLLILSAGAVITVVSLLVLHRQGRLPRQVSVSFIAPSTTLGGSRASDKDRAMLLLDTDN